MEDATIMPVHNAGQAKMPPHSDPKDSYMGPEVSAKGSMGDFYGTPSNTE